MYVCVSEGKKYSFFGKFGVHSPFCLITNDLLKQVFNTEKWVIHTWKDVCYVCSEAVSFIDVLIKTCSRNTLQIYMRTPMRKYDFNKVAV